MKISLRRSYRPLNTVRISSDALRHNWALYRGLFPGKAICPVLKANAYGHGLVEVARVLDAERPTFMMVDSLYEAYELQKAGIRSTILILGTTFPENLEGRRFPFHFAVSDLESARVLARRGVCLHLKVDTGMNRMGFSVDELPEVLAALSSCGAKVVGVLTHLADADNLIDDSYTEFQLARFREALEHIRKAGFNPEWIHAGQTAGSLKSSDTGNVVRLGLGLYGISPFEVTDSAGEFLLDLKPVMEFLSTVVGIRNLKKGDRVSYNGTFIAERAMTVAVVPVGYYEALPRALSGNGVMKIKGVMCPIVGRVCMNYTMVDVSEVEGVRLGDPVEVISADPEASNSLRALAKLVDTIPYELMTRVAASVRREVD